MQLEPLRLAEAGPVVCAALEGLRIAEPLTVSQTAERYIRLENSGGGYSGPYSFLDAPALRRPMDCLTVDSGYWLVAFMGPSQCGKSKIGDIWQAYSTIVDPADVIVVWPDKNIAQSYVVTQINKMIKLSPELQDLQMQTRSADNIFMKEFAGSVWIHAWPVPSQLRARPVPRFRVEDFDVIPRDVGGEGDVIMLLTGRQTTFEGQEIGYVNSSPALGPHHGIEALVASGTDESWYVDCFDCRSPFDLSPERLHFDNTGTPEDARRSAAIACPSCGGLSEQRHKRELMATGRWCGTGQTAVAGGVEGELAPNRIASFRYYGPMGFASYGRLAELSRAAEITYQQSQDEFELRAWHQSRMGVNFKSRLEDEAPLTIEQLQARALASDYELGTVPRGVRVLTAAVDVQGNRFPVLVQGWGEHFESWIIDRFDILALEDTTTGIKPESHPEHWRALLQKVIWRRYPLAADPGQKVPIVSTGIDTGGLKGVTDNAFEFFFAAVALGVPPAAITLIKGGNNPKSALLPSPTIDARRKKSKRDPDAELFVPNVHRFKDIINVRRRRLAPGPGYIHLPRDLAPAHIAEINAEEKKAGLWEKIPGQANETWDLLVYNAAVVTRWGGRDGALSWVPKSFLVPAAAGAPAPASQAATPAAAPRPPTDHPHARLGRRRRRGVRGQGS